MQKDKWGMGLCLLGMSSLVGFGMEGSLEASNLVSGTVVDTALPISVDPSAPASLGKLLPGEPGPGEFAALGFSCGTVPPALGRHLGLGAGEGVLVHSVVSGSRAAEVPLEAFDVILSVEGEVANVERLRAAVDAGHGVAMAVVSGGIMRDLIMGDGADAESEFLSTASLAPRHPMRRVGRLELLRKRYAETTFKFEERQRELEDEVRRERQLAADEMQALLKASDERVGAYFDQRQTEILSWLDAELAATRVTPLGQLGLDLPELIPAERLEALHAQLTELDELLEEAPAERLQLSVLGDHEGVAKRARKTIGKVMRRQTGRTEERVANPLSSLQRELQAHVDRLGFKHAGRVRWADETLASIRAQVHERVECAFDRSQEVFHKRLRDRLRRMELPRPGEVEASLEDLSGQVEAWSQRFITRSQFELQIYAQALNQRPDMLGAALLSELTAVEKAVSELQRQTDAALATQLSGTLVIDGSWQSSQSVKSLADGLEHQLESALLGASRVLGQASAGTIKALRVDRELSEAAWDDLRGGLGRLLQQAGDNCWELNGPYLDGRFPRPDPKLANLR